MLKFLQRDFLRGYVSELDQFLQELNSKIGVKSNARLDEEQKYSKIFMLRDNEIRTMPLSTPWNDF